MTQTVHRLGRQVLDVTASEAALTPGLQDELANLARGELARSINAVLDEYCVDETVLCLDRLVLDLGSIPMSAIGTELGERLRTCLRDELRTRSVLPGAGEVAGTTEKLVPQTPAERADAVIRQFLCSGTLPWWASITDPPDLAANLRLAASIPGFRDWLRTALVDDSGIRRRCLFQFEDDALIKLIICCLPSDRWSFWSNIEIMMGQLRSADAVLRRALPRMNLWEAAVAVSFPASCSTPPGKAGFLIALAERLLQTTPPAVITAAQTLAIAPPLARAKQASGYIDAVASALSSSVGAAPLPTIPPIAPAIKRDTEPEHAGSPPAMKPEFDVTTPKAVTSEYHVCNAGLVLLAPFLADYYSEIALTVKGGFRDQEARVRAAHAIQFLATGKTQHPEYQLPLNKLLCGIPLDTPVPTAIDLTQHERDCGQALLTRVIDTWPAIGNTSIRGLREAFILREGKLSRLPGEWLLQVERLTYDMLLDQLPWSFKLIRFSWQDDVLRVEW